MLFGRLNGGVLLVQPVIRAIHDTFKMYHLFNLGSCRDRRRTVFGYPISATVGSCCDRFIDVYEVPISRPISTPFSFDLLSLLLTK